MKTPKKKNNSVMLILLIVCAVVLAALLALTFWLEGQSLPNVDDTQPQTGTTGEPAPTVTDPQIPATTGTDTVPTDESTTPTTAPTTGNDVPTTAPTTGNDAPTTAPTQGGDAPTVQTQPTQPQTVVDGDVIKINTAYCTLQYPSQWESYLDIRQEYVEDSTATHFYCLIGQEELRLFTVSFGSTEVGNLFGYLPGENGRVAVYLDCGFLPEGHTLTEEQIQTFYTMLDGINSITQSISAAEGFAEP